MSPGGPHLLLITSLGPALPPGHAVPADDSVEQLQFVCELLIPRGEVVTVPGNQHISPQRSCPRGWGADREGASRPAIPDFAQAFRWLWGDRWQRGIGTGGLVCQGAISGLNG